MTTKKILKITFDTSVFIEDDNTDPKNKYSIDCRTICETLDSQGIAEISISKRLAADKKNDMDHSRKSRHNQRLDLYKQIDVGFRLDVEGNLDNSLLHGSTTDGDIGDELDSMFTRGITSKRRRQHSLYDADHIWAHWYNLGDYFITSDNQAIKLRSELLQKFSIKILLPKEFVFAYEAAIESNLELASIITLELERAIGLIKKER